MSHFFAYLDRLKLIRRWGLMRNTQPENNAEHSLFVSMIAHALAVIRNTYFGGSLDADRAAVLALYHDASEIITGDLPTPIKYHNADLTEAFHSVEQIARDRLLAMLPAPLQPVYTDILQPAPEDAPLWALVKAADKLSAYIKCIEERRMGNAEFAKAEQSILAGLQSQYGTEEVLWFLSNCIPAYEQSLDELGGQGDK